MNSAPIPELLPVQAQGLDVPTLVEDAGPAPVDVRRRPSLARRLLGSVRGAFAWGLRWLIGAALCLNYVTSVVVVGWVYRWTQAAVLQAWWKQSDFAREGTFREWCATLGVDGPVPRPRWFVRERVRDVLRRPWRGRPPTALRRFARVLTVPWHSLWLNFRLGVAGLLCVYLLTGWGCLLMLFGWEYGWVISFNKVYEMAGVGAGVSVAGILLLAATLCYVPLAMVHHAVTGDARAFLDVRFVLRLVNARLVSCVGLALLFLLASVPVEVMQILPFNPTFAGNNPDLSDAQVLEQFRQYLFNCCLAFFPILLLLRFAAARVYAGAVLKALRRGTVTRDELHPRLRGWLERLQILPVPRASTVGLFSRLGKVSRPLCVAGLYLTMFLAYVLMIAPNLYVREFFVYHPVTGFVNHPLVHFPAFDLIPSALQEAARE